MSVQPPLDRQPHQADVGGETLGPFLLQGEVGSGELGSFWRARSGEGHADAAPVLLKRLRREHLRSPEYRAALQREAELSATFRAAGFVRTLGFESAPEPYLVMEYVEGANLAVLLSAARRHDAESTRFALPLLVDALHALDYLHRGHDATGATCLTHQAPVARHVLAGVDGSARLIDFTLAMGPSTPRAPLCDHRLQPAEMAPEQVLAPSMVDPRADIFIAGITLWETLTGHRLFDGKNPLESQRRMLSGSIVPPSEASSGVHRTFDRICRRALARPRGERYPNAKEMASELRDEATRLGLWAEPAEIGAWVRSTLALGRTAPRTVSHHYPRSDVAQTMMGLGGPTPAVLSIADSYRQTQPTSSGRGGRKTRNSSVPSQAVRRDSTISITDPLEGDPTALITHGRRSQSPAVDGGEQAMHEVAAPDISRLGADAPGGVNDSAYDMPRARPRLGLAVMCVLGVALAGYGAYAFRAHQSVSASGKRAFGPTAVAGPSIAAPDAPALAPQAKVPPIAWPPAQPLDLAPAEPVAGPRSLEKPPAPAAEAAGVVQHAPQAAVPPPPAARVAEVHRRPVAAPAPVRKPATAAAPAASAEPARKGEPSLRWDVASTLGAGKADLARPAAAEPSWKASAPAEPKELAKDKPQAGAASSELPVNPY